MKTENKIKFGILVNLGITHDRISAPDPLKTEWFVKFDTYNYLHPFSESVTWEDYDQECDNFKGWADQIIAADTLCYHSYFFFVCYITDREGKPVEIRKIKQLHY